MPLEITAGLGTGLPSQGTRPHLGTDSAAPGGKNLTPSGPKDPGALPPGGGEKGVASGAWAGPGLPAWGQERQDFPVQEDKGLCDCRTQFNYPLVFVTANSFLLRFNPLLGGFESPGSMLSSTRL